MASPPSSAQLTRPVTHVPPHGARFVTPTFSHVSTGVPFVSLIEFTTDTEVVVPTELKNSSRIVAYAVVPVIRAVLGVMM